MKRNTLKLMALTSAVALGFAFTSGAQAQETETVNITLTTSSAITLTAGNDMDFGEWFLFHDGTNDITVVMNPFADTVVATPAGGTSAAVEITPSASIGSLLVQTPAAASLNAYGTITDFVDGSLTFATPTFSFNGGASTALSTNAGAPTAVGPTTGAVDDTMEFGGTITVSSTPPDLAHTASLDVTFDY